jgi:mannose-6-phosphate isomerase-like protein (cupin superfamily)
MAQAPDRPLGVQDAAPIAAPATSFQNDNQYTGEAASAPYLERIDVFQRWREQEGVPLVGGVYHRNLKTLDVGPWPRKGVLGAHCYLDGDDGTDEHVVEIPAGKSTIPEHHMYDEAVYVLSGRGACTVTQFDGAKTTFEFGEGAFFVVPLNATVQYHNGSGFQPCRFFSVTNLPQIMRQYLGNEDFIWNCNYDFKDRFGGQEEYFDGKGKLWRGRIWETNFVPDMKRMRLWEWKERGGGGTNAFFMLSGGAINSHVSRFQSGTYKKGHWHGPTAHLYVTHGEGYVLMRREGEDFIKCDWQEGSLYISGAGPGNWLHQHFNVGPTPAEYLVLGVHPARRYAMSRWQANDPTDRNTADLSVKKGGIQVEYEDEDRIVHQIFEDELRKRGTECRMKGYIPWCTGIEGPSKKGEWGDEKVAPV